MSQNPSSPIGPDLLGQLVDRHAAALELYARQLCRAADDAVQDAFVELARQRVAPLDPAAWLYRVVRNKALDASRAARRRQCHEHEAAAGRAAWFVESGASRVEARAATDALEQLAQEDRELVVLHIWGGRTFAEIGQLLGLSDSTAQRRYAAALEKIRESLGVAWAKNT